MTENGKFIGDFCSGCKKSFYHGDRIVLARNLKFFHFNCYAKYEDPVKKKKRSSY